MPQQPSRRVLFVCLHGAFRSRIAAAYFNAAAPPGWVAESRGVRPQSAVSERLGPVLAGTEAAAFIDARPPRSAAGVRADRTIAIDAELAGAETWRTGGDDDPVSDEEIRDEISARVRDLVAKLTAPTG